MQLLCYAVSGTELRYATQLFAIGSLGRQVVGGAGNLCVAERICWQSAHHHPRCLSMRRTVLVQLIQSHMPGTATACVRTQRSSTDAAV
eukprot:1890632-Rhodomonas_salina.1